MRLELRFGRPPSINRCYGTNWRTRKRFKTKPYERWLREAKQEVMIQQRPATITVPVRAEYRLQHPGRRADAGNYEKPISDMLVAMGIIQDDSLVRDVRCLWDDEAVGAVAIIETL